jgi:hypothetical protein
LLISVIHKFFRGASVDSGIPAAKVLSEKWLKTIKDNKGADNIELEKWEKERLVLVRICAKNK